MGMSAYWGLRPKGWIGYVVTIPIWVLSTAGIQFLVPMRRKPKVWGVPLVPWLPSLSIATNLFLMGSLGAQSFIRFGLCTGLMLVYYIFIGLHATYDVAHGFDGGNIEEHRVIDDNKMMSKCTEEGVATKSSVVVGY
ncbi:hypothetical protein HPP92_023216 [Vanilla planifolia]|nr:hypothetical protein HPP92_023216 [Vanilla planifolia]